MDVIGPADWLAGPGSIVMVMGDAANDDCYWWTVNQSLID